ncbi:MAG: PLDc N-terminal domain-containing protein [Actinomycetota bacterium]
MTGLVLGNSLVVLAAIGFWGFALFDLTRTDELVMRTFSKPVWVLLLVFTSVFGSLLWMFAGRPQRPAPR